MGFAVALPMVVGAGAGALMDKQNPLRGAMLGAVGGSVLGPTVAGFTGAGAAASEAALGMGMGEAAAGSAAQAAAAQGLTGLAVETPIYDAVLGEQLAGMGTEGMKHYLGSMGVSEGAQKAASLATMGPQGVLENLGMAGKSWLPSGGQAMQMAGKMLMQPPGQQPMPASTEASPPPPAPPPQMPMQPFITGMPQMNRRRRDPREEMWGY